MPQPYDQSVPHPLAAVVILLKWMAFHIRFIYIYIYLYIIIIVIIFASLWDSGENNGGLSVRLGFEGFDEY